MVSGIQSDDGSFIRKTFDDIEADILDKARDELGADVDLSQGSPIKQLFDVVIFEHEYLWETLEDTYYAAYYEDAYEEHLDKVLSLASMERILRRGASGEVTFSTNVANPFDVTIPRGTRVSTLPTDDTPAIPFKTTEAATLAAGASQVVGVPIRSLEPWETDLDTQWLGEETNVAAETIRRIDTPISGVSNVTNAWPTGVSSAEYNFVPGRDRETDHEFRQRFEDSLGEAGVATLDAIRAGVRQLHGIMGVAIEENTSMVDNTGSGGLPPKSFRLTVFGDASDNEIAQRIVEKRSAGIESYGSESGVGVTDDGETRTEYFDRATETTIYVTADVTHTDEYPDDGNKYVENNIIEYIGGTTVDGEDHEGTGMGIDVMYDLVFKAVMNVRGVFSADVLVGTTSPPGTTDDIVIDTQEVARTAPGAITVSDTLDTIP